MLQLACLLCSVHRSTWCRPLAVFLKREFLSASIYGSDLAQHSFARSTLLSLLPYQKPARHCRRVHITEIEKDGVVAVTPLQPSPSSTKVQVTTDIQIAYPGTLLGCLLNTSWLLLSMFLVAMVVVSLPSATDRDMTDGHLQKNIYCSLRIAESNSVVQVGWHRSAL